MPNGYTFFRVALGLFLLCTAGLKLWGGSSGALHQNTVLFSPAVRMFTIEIELLLGVWLISGVRPNFARWSAVLFFGLLAAVSLWLALQGQSSCGCFGRITVHPWVTFGIDIAVIALLVAIRPIIVPAPAMPWFAGFLKLTVGAALMLTLSAIGLMAAWQADLPTVLARLRGEPLSIEPFVSDLGTGTRGEGKPFEIRLTNHSANPITLIGGKSNCSCTFRVAWPLTIPAGETTTLPMAAKFSGSPGRFRQEYLFYTDNASQFIARGWIDGTVLGSEVSKSP